MGFLISLHFYLEAWRKAKGPSSALRQAWVGGGLTGAPQVNQAESPTTPPPTPVSAATFTGGSEKGIRSAL